MSRMDLVTEFVCRVREYLTPTATIRDHLPGGPGRTEIEPGELKENTFYDLNGEAVVAWCHALEDLALEAANGRLLALIQDFTGWRTLKERYQHLAATIEETTVVACGRAPRGGRALRMLVDARKACAAYRGVIYRGRTVLGTVLARQTHAAPAIEDRSFTAFFTFDPVLVDRLDTQIRDGIKHKRGEQVVPEFDRLEALDRANKQLQADFARVKKVMDQAMRRLQLEGPQYPPSQFTSEIQRSLAQIQHSTDRVPEMLARIGTCTEP